MIFFNYQVILQLIEKGFHIPHRVYRQGRFQKTGWKGRGTQNPLFSLSLSYLGNLKEGISPPPPENLEEAHSAPPPEYTFVQKWGKLPLIVCTAGLIHFKMSCRGIHTMVEEYLLYTTLSVRKVVVCPQHLALQISKNINRRPKIKRKPKQIV